MPVFKIKPSESVEIGKATFDKESDYKTVVLLTSSKNGDETVVSESTPRLLHKVLADNLIAKGRAKEAKKQTVEKKDDNMVSTKVKAE